jgi:hypothetical protein
MTTKDVTLQETYIRPADLAEIRAFSSPDVLVSSHYLDLDAELSGTVEEGAGSGAQSHRRS